MSGSDTVIQYKTNNDGTAGQLMSGPTVAPDIKAAVQAAFEDGVVTDTERQNIATAVEDSPLLVFLNQAGEYYRSAVRRSPFDSYIPFPAQIVLDSLDSPTYHETVRDAMFNYAAANGTAFDPNLAAATPYVPTSDPEGNKL